MMSVAHAAIVCVDAPSSILAFIRQVAAGPRIWLPSMMRPRPLSSASFANETLAPLFTNTLLQTLASVVHAPLRKRIYYVEGQRLYAQGSTGTFVCRKEAGRSG